MQPSIIAARSEAERIQSEIIAALQSDFPNPWDMVAETTDDSAVLECSQQNAGVVVVFEIIAACDGALGASGEVRGSHGRSAIMVPFSGDAEHGPCVDAAGLVANVRQALAEVG